MDWASYLARGVSSPSSHPSHRIIYHMTERVDFAHQTENGGLYFPPTYQTDGFVHATADASFLLNIGNMFYKENMGDWICLEIDTSKLLAPVKYEPAAAVGNVKHTKVGDNEPLFPHIYGGINADAVTNQLNIVRSLDGSFDSIDGLVRKLASTGLN